MDTLIILDMIYISSDLLCTGGVCLVFALSQLAILSRFQLIQRQNAISLQYRTQ